MDNIDCSIFSMLFLNSFHSAARSIDRSNAKLGEDMNHFALFGVLLRFLVSHFPFARDQRPLENS